MSNTPPTLDQSDDAVSDRCLEWLRDAGLRPTRQRMALAKLLMGDGQHRHITAEALYAAASVQDQKVSLATVYNTLHAFSKVGLVREVMVDGAKSHFDTNTTDHPHYFWEDEGTLSDAPQGSIAVQTLPTAPEGAEVVGVDMVIRLRRKARK